MKSLLTLIVFLVVILSSQAQSSTLTEYQMSASGNGQLSISALFSGSTASNVLFGNTSINILIPEGYSNPISSNPLYVPNIIPATTIDGLCSSGLSYNLLNLVIDAEQNLGSITDNIPEFLVTITFSGVDPLPAVGLQFPTIDALQTCLVGIGLDNTGSVRISGNTIGYSNRNISPNQIFLPIILTSFDVTKHNERSSKLNWKTSSEINSDFFGIERSKDGNNWETIGRVTAAGNSSKEQAYEFIDDNLPLIRTKEQVFYYRLRMTDLDGQYKYSDVRGVNFGKLSTGVVTIYPNPTVEHINVDLSGMDLDAGKVDLFVYDMTGRQVIKKSIIGNGIELIDVSLLPASTYNVVVKQGETAYQQRVIKID